MTTHQTQMLHEHICDAADVVVTVDRTYARTRSLFDCIIKDKLFFLHSAMNNRTKTLTQPNKPSTELCSSSRIHIQTHICSYIANGTRVIQQSLTRLNVQYV